MTVSLELLPGPGARISPSSSENEIATGQPIELLLAQVGGSGEHRLATSVPGEAEVDLPLGSTWHLSSGSDRLWIPTRELTVGEGDPLDATKLSVYPAGQISVGLRSPSAELPGALHVQISPAGDDGRQWLETCPVAEGSALCPVPAGRYHLRFAAEGFVPHYFWDLDLPVGDVLRLGTLDLRPGGSVAGWVEAPTADFRFDEVTIELRALSAGPLGAEARRRVGGTESRARVDDQGFFQVRGLRTGRYQMVVDHPDYVADRSTLEVEAGRELELSPLALSEGASLDLRFRPATDPFRRPWQASLFYRGAEQGYIEEERSGLSPDESGDLRVLGLPAGTYLLEVRDSREGRWHAEHLELFEGSNVHEREIRFERLEVTLLLGDEPLVGARVDIREHGGNAQQAFRSREGGKVYAFLRADRRWDFEIDHPERGVTAGFRRVEVPERAEGDRHPKIELAIPATRIFGRLIDFAGEPFRGVAWMDFSAKGTSTFQRRIEGSEFDVWGLPEGPVAIQASEQAHDGRLLAQSERVHVQLEEDRDEGPLVLRMAPTRTLSGLVVAPDGRGVPGAQVVALLETGGAPGLTAGVPTTTTDLEGAFDLDLPASADAVQLTVYPPGFTVVQQRIRMSTREGVPVILPVDDQGGTVVLHYETTPEGWLEEGYHMTLNAIIFTPHAHVPFYLMRWAESPRQVPTSGMEWVIPGMPPGAVRVCFGSDVRALLETGSEVPSSAGSPCDEGVLEPGGRLALTIREELLEQEAEILAKTNG